MQVRRSPAAVSPRIDAQTDKPLHVVIDVWEGRAETDKPEDLPKQKVSALLSRKKHPVGKIRPTKSMGGHNYQQDVVYVRLEVLMMHSHPA